MLDAHGGLDRWAGARTITAHLSIGGPIWAANGWAGALTEQTLTVDTRRERSVFTPFTAPDLRSVFEVGPERVTIDTSECEVVQQRTHPRDAFTGFLRAPWDRLHLAYFIGYANWNYLTTPLLLTYPGVMAHEIQPWHEAGQQWRRLRVTFPETIATHSPEQVCSATTGPRCCTRPCARSSTPTPRATPDSRWTSQARCSPATTTLPSPRSAANSTDWSRTYSPSSAPQCPKN